MRVLFLTHRLPYAPNRGDRVRAFHIVRELVTRGCTVDVVSLVHDAKELAQVGRVRELGADATAVHVPRMRNYASGAVALAGTQPLTHVLLDAPQFGDAVRRIVQSREPDVVLAYCSSMARFALEPPLASYPLVLDLVDVDSHKWKAMADGASRPKRWIYQREVRYLSQFERLAATRACATLVVNEREAETLHALAPEAAVHVVPVGVDVAAFQPRHAPTEAPRVVFCGVMNYAPNVEGVVWFVRDVWPLVRARRPDAIFTIVGSNPTSAVARLASPSAGVEVTGEVTSVQPYLWDAAVAVAPLLTARGVQTKVLEAVVAGLPAIVTRAVHDGLPAEIYPACRVADTPAAFADETIALLNMSGPERRRAATIADARVLDWPSRLAPLYGILADAVATKVPVRS